MSKYHSQKVVIGGETFDSKKEARRYAILKALEQAGRITDLQRQVKYVLIPEQREMPTVIVRGKNKGQVKLGKIIKRECAYYADFVYTDLETGKQVVEDVKGFKTKEFLIKDKLMLYVHHIQVTLI